MGHQYSKWLGSKHAQGYVALFKAESREIAKVSGLRGDPWKEPICLGCHSTGSSADERDFDDGFGVEDGLQCEACHGPGSEYMGEAVMRNRMAAMQAGLRMPKKDDCLGCHIEKGSHVAVLKDPTVNLAKAIQEIAHPLPKPSRLPAQPTAAAAAPSRAVPLPAPAPAETRYKTPLNMAVRPGSGELWVTLEASDGVAIIDMQTGRRSAEIGTGSAATGVAFTPDGRRAFVSNRQDDTVSVIDAGQRKVVATLRTGDEPHGLLCDKAGKYLYVLNTSSEDIHVYDAAALKFVKRLAAGRGPWAAALSPDGSTLAVTNTYSHLTGFRKPLMGEVTLIDTGRAMVRDRRMVEGANLMTGIAWHPSGEYALATMNRTKGLVPMTRLMQGWTITNGLAVIWKDGAVDQVLLDQPGLGFADATAVAITPDGRYALVTSSGTNRVAVVDCAKLTGLLKKATAEQRRAVLPNHLGKSAEFVVKYVAVADSPRGVAVAPDGARGYVANSIDDSVSVIDVRKMQAAGRVELGGPREISRQRFGERLFHNAQVTFRKQFSCHSCHPDGHVDGIVYDIEADGIGVSPVENRTLRGVLDTAPFKWEGTNPSLQRQCGARLSIFFTRALPFSAEELKALDYYITTIPRPPNRHYTPGTKYTAAQRRGKDNFERTMTNDGRAIPPEGQCVYCHMPPYYTNRQVFDVGTKQELDKTGKFDVPHLNNIYDSAPYLHNGMAKTLEEIWTVYNPYDQHGYSNDMTKDQLNDLIEYLKTL
jgi:YVTN family beta-propeller protein